MCNSNYATSMQLPYIFNESKFDDTNKSIFS